MHEIERKYLLNYLPESIVPGKGSTIRQGYLVIEEDNEIRIRQYGRKYFLTLKSDSGLKREETEVEISAKQFKSLWPLTKQLRFQKERHRIKSDGHIVEVDLFAGYLGGLRLAEVEFETEEASVKYSPPEWIGREVTEDKLFRNRTLAGMRDEEVREKLQDYVKPPEKAVGAVPILEMNNERHYVLITTKGAGRWIFPKGCPSSEIDDYEMASIEALEEAGVKGKAGGKPVFVYYWKGSQLFRIEYYRLEVEQLLMEWEESGERDRRICKFEEAVQLLDDVSYISALKRIHSF